MNQEKSRVKFIYNSVSLFTIFDNQKFEIFLIQESRHACLSVRIASWMVIMKDMISTCSNHRQEALVIVAMKLS